MNVNTVQKTQEIAVPGTLSAEAEVSNKVNKTAEQGQSSFIEQKQQQEEAPPVQEMKELANDLNEYMDDLQTDLGFFINEELNDQVIVEIKNRKTNELVKQIPSEEIIEIREKMAELTGLILDKSV